MKKLGIVLLAVIIAGAAAGCSDSGGNPIVGKWKNVRIDKPLWVPPLPNLSTVEFKKDGTVGFGSLSYPYRILEQGRFEIDFGNYKAAYPYSVNGGSLEMACPGIVAHAQCRAFYERAE